MPNVATKLTILLLLYSQFAFSYASDTTNTKAKCNSAQAFAAGLADAHSHQAADLHYGSACLNDDKQITRAYNSGYNQAGLSHNAHHNNKWALKHCIKNQAGKIACGYNCIQTKTDIKCANLPDKQCIADRNGKITCGYSCIMTSAGVKCAIRKQDNCVMNKTGDSQCGFNCRIENQKIKCGATPSLEAK